LIKTRRAYELYARACGIEENNIKEAVDSKLQTMIDMQTYPGEPDESKAKLRRLMEAHHFLELDYIGKIDDDVYSILEKYDPATGEMEKTEKIKWPGGGNKWGLMLHQVSKYKCENQDNYLPFLRGEFVFFADATSDARIEDGIKLIHSLMEFRKDPGINLLVFREYLYTNTNNWIANCIAFADRTWSSITQRNLNLMGSVGFYGHSSIIPLKAVHEYAAMQVDYVSEDIALPMRFWAMGKNYKSKHIE